MQINPHLNKFGWTGSTDAASLTHQASPQNPWNKQSVLPQLASIKHLSVKSAYWIRVAFQIQVVLGVQWVKLRGPGQRAFHIFENTQFETRSYNNPTTSKQISPEPFTSQRLRLLFYPHKTYITVYKE